ncbi:M36 family metallopeptidase [Aquimarina brevivitae]|uniref:Putative secreted protein (Por secretion system target) n=1 Tax=Aquimarina brevivitae TaxID=323412 RepID=A0A4Q7P1V4_9FLAO|nr:M36 family metallopeptidase [Aquimarina brevivitae]RZS93360.1 putative secreted protein (Por secretion system target) [Aquimarina brevivitae]
MKKLYLLVVLLLTISTTLIAQQNFDAIVRDHFSDDLQKNSSEVDKAEWVITDVVPSLNPNVKHVYVQQRFQGIPIKFATYKLTIRDGKKVTWTIDQFIKDVESKVVSAKSSLSPESAISTVASKHSIAVPSGLQKSTLTKNNAPVFEYKTNGATLEPIKVNQEFIEHEGKLKLTWNVSLYPKDGQHWWNANVDATTGKILYEEDWVISCDFGTPDHSTHGHSSASVLNKTAENNIIGPMPALAPDSYNVYAVPVESPIHGGRSIVTNPADPIASPFGWHDTNGSAGAEFTITRGNNVWAQEDRNGNNGTGFSPDGGSGLDFNFPIDLSQSPTSYQSGAITNLFYWNNIVHDVFYQYGFDEASGNFQENNYGKGGAGSDSVNADAQDGSGTNNANFATPGDGGNPRMQMFLWNQTNPGRDGDLDNVIIIHEYGHGISIRLVGGPNSNTLGGSEQMGEGWSDWFGLMLTMKPGDVGTAGRGVGSYVLGQPADGAGIRPTRYSIDRSINNTDYADIDGLAVPHGVGYAWATILWDMTWALIDAEGFDPDLYNGTGGNNIALALVTEGLKNTANNPGFVSGRDGILQADQDLYGGQYNCIIWKAFADRGVGQGANENNNGGSNGKTDQTVSFVNPCDNPPPPPGGDCSGDISSFPYNESFEGSVGDWVQETGDDLDWTVNSGTTPSSGTGPNGAIDGNSYIYVEASGNGTGFPNKQAILSSSCLDFSGLTSPSLNFQYHMIGSDVGTFDVEARVNNTGDWVSIFNRFGAQGTDWNTAAVDLSAYAGEAVVQLRLNVTTGASWQGDITVDGLSITDGNTPPPPGGCSGGITSYPYNESFEGSIGAWSQASGDDLDWSVNSGGTPSSNTGPSSAADGSSYIYVEASGNGTGFPDKLAVLESPCLDLTSIADPTLSFQYHMFGSAINSLNVEARAGTNAWASVFSRNGQQGSTWNTASVDLSAYAGEASVQLRISVRTGTGSSGWQSDIAIDALSITDGGTPPPPPCDSLNFNSFTINAFANQDAAGNYTIINGGDALSLSNNTWKFIPLGYTVTSNTVIEFDFSSSSQGEIHGIAFEDDNTLTSTRVFKVHGSQNYGITNYDNYSGGTTTYVIPVGNFYTGNMDRLVFINDNDAGSGNTSIFSNVKIYEGSCAGSPIVADFGNANPIYGDEDEGLLGAISLTPNPTRNNFTVEVSKNFAKNAGEITATIYSIIGNKQSVLKLSAGVNSLSAKSLNLRTGIYLIKIESPGEEPVIQKLVVQ